MNGPTMFAIPPIKPSIPTQLPRFSFGTKSKEIADKITSIGITNPLNKPDKRKKISLEA